MPYPRRLILNRFDLLKPVDESPQCYKNFYHLFYLTVITDKFLYSSILENTIILQDSYGLDKTTSDNVQDFLQEILYNNNIDTYRNQYYFECIGCKLTDTETKEVINYKDRLPSLNILQELYSHTSNVSNYEEMIKGMLNIREFQMLYSFIESSIDELSSKIGYTAQRIKKEKLNSLNFLIRAEKLGLVKLNDYIIDIWNFYILVRNLYAHNYGFFANQNKINQFVNSERYKKCVSIIQEKIDYMGMAYTCDDFFNIDNIATNRMYLLNDFETLIFRDIAIDIMESINNMYIVKNKK